jgi:hypothetical protein
MIDVSTCTHRRVKRALAGLSQCLDCGEQMRFRPLLRQPALPLCCICGNRDATTETDLDGRTRPVCKPCITAPKGEGYAPEMSLSSRAILIARTCQGLTPSQIAAELGYSGGYGVHGDVEHFRAQDAIQQGLSRAARVGVLRVEGTPGNRTYYRGPEDWRPNTKNGRKVGGSWPR